MKFLIMWYLSLQKKGEMNRRETERKSVMETKGGEGFQQWESLVLEKA